MKLVCTVLVLFGAATQRVFAADCSNMASPVCLHVGDDIENDYRNRCLMEKAIEENGYKEYTSFTGRCFRKKCGEDAAKVINTGTSICVKFVDLTQQTFHDETILNDYLCNNPDAKVASIPGNSIC